MRLILAAADCFAERGFEGASTRDIAKGADVAQQLITYHFGTKEDLWKATVKHLQHSFEETSRRLHFKPDGDLREQFREHWTVLMTHRVRHPQIQKIMIQEYLAGTDRFHDVIAPMMQNLYKTIARPYFEKVVELGIVTRYSVGDVGVICNAIVNQYILNPPLVQRHLGLETNSEEAITYQIDLLMKMLTGEDTPSVQTAGDRLDNADMARLAELENLVVELSLENRKLRSLTKKSGIPSDST